MVAISRVRTPLFRPPVSGSKALFLGNSKTDTFAALGQWADALCVRYGWQRLAANMVPNGRADTDTQGMWMVALVPATSLSRIAATAMTGVGGVTTPPASVGGSNVFKIIPTTGDGAIFLSPYAPAAISQGTNTSGDAVGGQFNCNMQPGYTYCWSCYVLVPAAQAAGSITLTMNDNVGAIATSTAATSGGGWQRLSVIGAVATGRTQAWCRLLDTDTNTAHQFYATGFQLERVPNPSPYTGYPVAWTDHYRRAAISGSILESNDTAANAGGAPRGIATDAVTRLAASVTGLATPPDIIFVLDNINDLYYTSGAGAITPMTAATWRNGMHAVIPALVGMANSPKVVVLGCTNSLQPYPGGVGGFAIVGGTGYTNGAAVGALTNTAGYPAGTGFAGTLIVSAGAITGVTITTPGIGWQLGATAAMSGGTGGSLTVNSLVNLGIPFGAASMDAAAATMDAITRNECELAGALFVPLRGLMNGGALIQAGALGKHPNLVGEQAIADLVAYALETGT